MNKKCTKCNEVKPQEEFHKKKSNPDGYRYKCKECRKSDSRREYLQNRDKLIAYQKNYYSLNTEKVMASQREYNRNNKPKIRETKRVYKRAKREVNPVYNMAERVSRQLRRALTTEIACKKGSMLYPITTLTGVELINHLHETFELNYGMPRSWIDLKDVQIDHIIPISTAKTIEDVKELNHYSNLQLLFKEDNQRKGTKVLDRLG